MRSSLHQSRKDRHRYVLQESENRRNRSDLQKVGKVRYWSCLNLPLQESTRKVSLFFFAVIPLAYSKKPPTEQYKLIWTINKKGNYNSVGIHDVDLIIQNKMKEILKNEYMKRTRTIFETEFHRKKYQKNITNKNMFFDLIYRQHQQ